MAFWDAKSESRELKKLKTSNLQAIWLRYVEVKKRKGKREARKLVFVKAIGLLSSLRSPARLIMWVMHEFEKRALYRRERSILCASGVAEPLQKKGISIHFVVGGFMAAGGGHRNIVRIAHYLQGQGYEVALAVCDVASGDERLKKQVRELYPFNGNVFRLNRGPSCFAPDIAIATQWETVELLELQYSKASLKAYLVQDLEYLFYAMGDDHIAARSTYGRGLAHICSGPWCAETLRRDFNADADYFQFPLDRHVYNLDGEVTRVRNRIAFFAKPEMPRRCFLLGVRALSIVSSQVDVEIIMYGSRMISDYDLDFEYTDYGVISTIGEVSNLYKSAAVGMAFSTTNPSLVPFEMMACGALVVDLDLDSAEVNYGSRDDIALLAQPTPEHLAETIITALSLSKEDYDARQSACINFTSRLPDENDIGATVERFLMDRWT